MSTVTDRGGDDRSGGLGLRRSDRPRILIAVFPQGVGGPQRHVEALRASADFNERFEVETWEVEDRYRGWNGKVALKAATERRLRALDPAAVYVNLDLSLAFWLTLAIRACSRVPLVIHAHNSTFASPRAPALQDVFRRSLGALATRRIAVSPEAAVAMFGSTADVSIIPSLIDFEALRGVARVVGTCGTRDGFRFVCIGRLAPQKNQALAIAALSRLMAQGLDARLILVGDGEDRSKLARMSAELGVADRVSFAGEMRSAASILAHGTDALVVPSRFEGQSRVVAEAQSFGIPVLASVGVPDSAWLLDRPYDRRHLPLDPSAWAQAMWEVMATGQRGEWISEITLQGVPHGVVEGGRRLADLLATVIRGPCPGCVDVFDSGSRETR